MEKVVLFLALLISMNFESVNPEMNISNDPPEQTVTSNDCGENCQLPSKPDDDEDED